MLTDKTNRFGLTQSDIEENKAFINSLPKRKDKPEKKERKPSKKADKNEIRPLTQRYIDYILVNRQVTKLELAKEFGNGYIYNNKCSDSVLSTGLVKYDAKTKMFHDPSHKPRAYEKNTVICKLARYIKRKKVVSLKELNRHFKSAKTQAATIRKQGLIENVERGLYKWVGS